MADADLPLANLPRQCAVVVRPDLLAESDGRPALSLLLREALRWGVDEILLLTRAGQALPLEALSAGLPRAARLLVAESPAHVGTGGALSRACDQLQRRFLLICGAAFPDSLGPALAAFASDGNRVDGRLLARPAGQAPGRLRLRMLGNRVQGLESEDGAGMADGGVALLDRHALEGAADDSSFERDVLPAVASRGGLRATAADRWVEAFGPPAPRPALLLGWRGVLRTKVGASPDGWTRGAEAAVRRAGAQGWHVFAVARETASIGAPARELLAGGGAIEDRGPDPDRLLRAWGADAGRSVLIEGAAEPPAAFGGSARRRFHGGDLDALAAELLRGEKRAAP